MIKYSLKLLLSSVSLLVFIVIGTLIANGCGFTQPTIPQGADMKLMAQLSILSSGLLTFSMAEVVRRLRGGILLRGLLVGLLVYACLGVANALEGAVFTRVGGLGFLMASFAFASLPQGLLMATLFKGSPEPLTWGDLVRELRTRPLCLICCGTWLAFPLSYFVFGVPVGWVVADTYASQAYGLVLPSLGTVIGLQLLRGLVLVPVTVALLGAWSPTQAQSRVWVIGFSLTAALGLFGLIQAHWMPISMRSLHSLEIFADSLLYLFIATRLFALPGRTPASAATPAAALSQPSPHA